MGKTDYKHTIHSIRKPLISALYGIYVERGVIDTTATLKDLKIDDILPSFPENSKISEMKESLKEVVANSNRRRKTIRKINQRKANKT